MAEFAPGRLLSGLRTLCWSVLIGFVKKKISVVGLVSRDSKNEIISDKETDRTLRRSLLVTDWFTGHFGMSVLFTGWLVQVCQDQSRSDVNLAEKEHAVNRVEGV